MKNTRDNGQKRVKNCLKWTASGLLLALMFVLVFAGTLSGAFGIENELQQNGIIQSNVASADWNHKAGIDIGDTNSGGYNVTAMNAISEADTYNYFSNTANDTAITSKFGIYMSDGSSSDCQKDHNTIAIDQGPSTSGRNGMIYAVIPLSAEVQKVVAQGRLSMSFSAYFEGGNSSYSSYRIFAYSSSLAVTPGVSYSQAAFKDSILNNTTTSATSSQNNTTTATGNAGYCNATGIPDKDWNSSHSEFSYRTITANVLPGAKSIIFGCIVRGGGYHGAGWRHMEVSIGRPTITFHCSSASIEVTAGDNGTIDNVSLNNATINGTTYTFNKVQANATIDAIPTEGYHFDKWEKTYNGETSIWTNAISNYAKSTATFYSYNVLQNEQYKAYFSINKISVVFHRNLVSGDTQQRTQEYTYNGNDLSLGHWENTANKTFVGWAKADSPNDVYHKYGKTAGGTYDCVASQSDIAGKSLVNALDHGSTIHLYAVWVDSDFGVLSGKDKDSTWGLETNPFVISNVQHLKNLSDIVNGSRDPVDSVYGVFYGENINTAASDIKFENCYFVVAADLGAGTAIELVPIGKDSTHYFAGTIFGGNDSDANNRTMRTINLNIQQSGVSNVGLFGYVKGATISHLTTAGTIVGGAAVGGLVGYADGVTISNCRNNATVKALGSAVTFGDTQGAYLGGFVGYATASVTIKNCYNGGEIITETKWENSNIVGGIVGHLETGGQVSYCYNIGKVVGSDNIGGIVGINNGTVSFCYQGGGLNDLYSGTKPSNFITSNGGTITNCWILPGAKQTGFNQDTTPNGKKLELFDINGSKNNKMYAPVVVGVNTYTVPTGKWESIVEKDINGFEVFVADTNGNKSLLQKGEYLRSAKAIDWATTATPTIIDSNATANSNGHTRQDSTTIDIVYVYSATVGNDVFVSHSKIGKTVSNTTYNGQNQGIGNIANLPTDTDAGVFYFGKGNAASTATPNKKDWRAGGYDVVVDIKIGDKVVGRDVFDWTINKKTLTVEYQWTSGLYNNGSVVYNGAQQGLLSFEIKGFVANESVASGNAMVALTYTNTDYTLAGNKYTLKKDKSTNAGQYGVSFTLEANNYALDTNATHEFSWTISRKSITIGTSSFYYGTNIEQKLTDGTVFQNLVSGHSVRVDTQKHNFYKQNIGNNQYTILQSDITVNDNSGQPVTGNYTVQSVTITVLAGDFWSNGTTDIANNPWGSQHNPYVIGKKEQLTRLSAIVGGTSAVNSIKNDTYVYVQAQSGNYSNAYFKLADNILSVGNIPPIGSNTHSFAGNFDGNNKTISGLNISVAGNNVGLFGYISGATIKNLTVNGSVKGSSNVGGVVGYALNSTIENVTNNASVNADYTDISYTIRQVDATPVSGGDKNYPSGENAYQINDGNVGTKYCGTKKAPMSFIAEINNVQSIVGFAIQNATDTSANPKRTPKKVTIWGSNNGNEIPSESWGQSGGGNKPTSWSGYTSWVEIYTSDDIKLQSTDNRKNIEFDSTHTYRYYWVYIEGTDKQLQFAEFDFLSPRDNIGGVVGYASDTTITTIANNGSVSGGKNVGGIVGKICAGSVENCINKGAVSATSQAGGIIGNTNGVTVKNCKNEAGGTVTATGNAAVGGIVGGLNDGGTLVIEKCENNAAINASNANGVAGIVGHNPSSAVSITVTSCKNTGVITGSLNVGGIGGRIETTQNERLKLVFRNCYNSAAIYAKRTSQYGTVGGIIGYLYANGTTQSDVAVIEYCFSSGYVESTSGINEGGIVGNATSSTSLSVRVSYCYTTNTAHSIAGYSGATISSSYVIMNSDSSTPDTKNDARFFVYNGNKTSYAPAVIVKNGDNITSCTKYAWEDILTTNINGFMVQATVNPGASQYYHTANGTSSTVYIKPDRIENNHIANAENRNDATSFELTAWYASERNGNYYCDVKEIAISDKSTTYNGGNQGFDFGDVTPKNGSVYSISFDYVYNYNGRIETVPNEVGTYDTTVFVKIDGIVVGKKMGAKYTVDKAALNVGWEWTDKLHANLYDRTGNGDKVQFVYNGKAQGLSSVSQHLGDAALFAVTGNNLTNTNAATYTRTYTLKDTRNYKLQNANNNNADLSGTTVTFEWKIRKNKLTVSNYWTGADLNPSGEFYTFEYNATHQGLKLQDGITFYVEPDTRGNQHVIDTIAYEIAQGVECVAADTYTRTFTIKDTTNYEVGNRLSYNTSVLPNQKGSDVNTEKSVVTYTWKIVPYSLVANISNVWFGGTTNLIVGNQGIANVEDDTTRSFYPLQADRKGAPGVQQVLVYAQHNYAVGNFVLYVKYNNGTVAVLTQGTEYTVGTLDKNNTFGTFVNVVSQADPVVDTNVTASGTGNFSGNITKYYTAMFSDFGWKKDKSPSDEDWGSQDNPYVISTPEHLLRLSQIVNGGMAWNSIQNTVTAGVCIAPQTTAKATSRDYKDAYFLVTVDIDMSGYISTDGVYNFLPIGTRSTQNQTELPFSATFDGGDNTITYVYNVGSFYNVDGARTNYVGLFGYLNGATISNLKVASNGGLSITDNDGIVGIEYVGGIAGCAVDSTLYNTVLAYGGWVRGENYVGGIVGYGERITIVSSEAVSSANVGGETYVGGIVGKWIVSNQNQIGGSVAGQRYVTPADQTDVMGIKYVGGIAGWMDTSSCATTISYAPQLNNNGKEQNLIVVGGIEYVGALFGAFIGNGYHQNATNDKYTAIVIDKDASDKFKVGNVKVLLQKLNDKSASGNAKVVGGLVGYAEGVGILFNTDWTTSNVTLDTGNYTPSFIGGIAGVLGKNATIEAIYQLKDDGTFLTGGTHTITHSVPDKQTFGTAAKPLGSFVGGIVGYVSSQAGVYWETGTTIFGNGISLVNSATIYATSYAGGIFGALGDLSTSVASSFESDTDSILYKVLTTGVREGSASTTLGLAPTVDSNGITAKGRLVNNASISVSGSYVGGIAGYGGAKVRFVLRNTPQDSAIDVSKLNIYSGGSDIFINGSYAGGIAGYLVDNLEHDLQYIVVKARFNTNNQSATRVGGLVGYMGSGNVQNCVVTNGGSSAITASTDTYQGSEYVGGLVGETQNATIRNSVSTGFNLEKTSNTKGGLLGYGANPTIDSSWTFYIAKKRTNFAKNATPNGAYYATVSQSPYGKYILVDEGLINATEASYPTFVSLCGFVGLLTNANVEGTLELAVKVPNKTLNSNYENTQLAFYNASGNDTVTDNVDSFSKFENNNNTLTIALDMASGNSMQICVVGIEFVNVAKWNSSNPLYSVTDGATKNVENSYKKPSDSDSYSADVTNNNSGTVASNPTKIYDDEGNLRYIQAIVYFNGVIVGATVENKQQVGQYDSGELTPGSSATTPYTISNQQEWNDFAYSIYSGANNYSGKYVKLLTDSIVINTGNGGQHAGTKGSHNFGSVQAIPSAGQNAPLTDANGNAVDRNNIGYNFAGDISKDSNVNNFHGTFDGNGHYITVEYGSGGFYRVSVFPNAAGATFRNLTIKGYIQAAKQNTGANGIANSAAYDVAGFVGKPFGTLKFYNCTNEADIIGLRNVAGLVGYNAGGHSITLEACVNTGDITSLQGSYTLGGYNNSKYNYDDNLDGTGVGITNIGYTFGTGGIIGAYTGTIQIESCRNAGTIIGGHNVGGIIGLHEGTSSSVSTLTINNCANSGEIRSNSGYWGEDEGQIGGDASRGVRQSTFGYAGGLVGKTGRYSILKMYSSYNSGWVVTLSNIAGGLVGSVGTMNQPSGNKNSVLTGGRSVIAYCYNVGKVNSGGTFPKRTKNYEGYGRENFGGAIVGGVAGLVGNIQITQTYNAGEVWQFGIICYGGSWQVRAAGIVGQSQPTSNGYVLFDNVYNVGTVYVRAINTHVLWGAGGELFKDARYGAAISGYCDTTDAAKRIYSFECYSINNCVSSHIAKDISGDNNYLPYKNGTNSWESAEKFDEYYQNGGIAGIGASNADLIETGMVYNTYDSLTAAMNSQSKLYMNGSNFAFSQSNAVFDLNFNSNLGTYTTVAAINSVSANAVTGTTNTNVSAASWVRYPDSWLYVYGCLPQLSVFALDTQNGLSMRSIGYGQDQYGEFNENGLPAGSEQYPFIIKDGIDLMGMQALVDTGYSFVGQYIEVANGENNLDGLAATRIKFPTYASTGTAATDGASNTMFKAVDKDGSYKVGKSYHLLLKGAVFNKARNEDATYVGTDYGYWAYNTYYYNGAYDDEYGYFGDMRPYGIFSIQNFIPMGRGNNVFKGHFSGKQDGDKSTIIDDLRITTGKDGGGYGGLFAKVQDAYIGYISIGGTSKVSAYSYDNSTEAGAGGIVGKALGSTVIENCGVADSVQIGAYGRTDKVTISSDGITFAGGIAGVADPIQGNSYNAGITLTIRNCSVSTSGIIESAKSNIGGVLGYVAGSDIASGKSNTVRIEGCSVDKAVIQAASSANTSSQIGGILGYGSQYVAAFITGCKVGVGGTVSIKGEHSLGGIAGGMSNAKGGYIDSCTVGANTTIERIDVGGDKTVLESENHGTAIGGLVGFTQNSNDDTSPLTTTFSGTSAFKGTITVSVEATNPSTDSDGKISCIGGIVGDMGSGANFASGSNVTVGGTINITLAAANVGGVVGRTNKATFIGKFNVAPNMSTENAENVGGFIGKNIGTVYILADTTDKLENTTVGALNGTEITIGGKIKGTSEVGGFIGVNNSGSTLNIGSNVANAKPYKSGTLTITITASVTGSGDNVGGIVGKNEGDDENTQDNDYATIDIVKGTIEQNGAIIGANNVGGIIGLNDGLLTTGGGEADTTIGGVTLSEEQQNKIKNLSINNTGSVTGTGDYVGGVVGKLDSPSALRTEDSGKGAIAGTFTNSGNVSGGKFVGGSLGYVGKNVTITAKNNVATLFVNDGQVTATGYYAGGSIGVLVGKIEGVDNGHTVNFKNTGTVTATGFVGGSIGVLAGPVKYAQFVNSSGNLSIAAVNAVGGSVGFIGVPTPLETILTGVADDYVKVENTHFEASGELTANPDSNAISVAKDAATNKSTGWGGVGGAIGVIGKNVRWGTEQNKNTYYANGNVTANGINNVGGIVGIILAENVNISNMLAYNTTVKGGENVGGIVGATDGIGTVITSAYAIEGTFTGSKNVGGIIGLAKTDTDASTSYWVKGYTNAILAGTDVKNLQQDLGKFETIIEHVGEQPIVFTEEFCKMYTPKTYYDDYPGTHTYNGKTITLGENVEQLTWYDYFKDKLGETSAQIKNGAWVKPIANAPTYTTGANNTGWYFVYATDKTIGTINAEHSTNANLQYWKRIADAYTSSERNEGKDDNAKNPLASDIVLGNGAPQKSTLYATATAAGTESGYYLYMATSGKSRPSATNQGNKFYIQTLTTNADALAENVAVYYRTISKGKALTFNGYLRYAPVGITASEGETVSYIKNPETATGKPNSYCYSADTTTAGGQGTDGAQTNPGSFHSQVNIYYFDSEGKPHVVGGVAIGWTINKRDLTAEFTANTDRTYGEDRKQEGDGTVKHDMKLVVGNIAPKADKNAGIVITISSDNESYTFTWDGTSFDKTSAGGIVISAAGMTDPGATNGWDASDSLYNVTEPDDKQTKDFSCFIDFTNAKTYTISVTTTATSGAQYTLDKTTNFSVKQATLTLKGVPTTNNPDSVIFDNKTHAFSWKVEGFKYNDDISQLALFSPTAYALGKSAPLFNSGTPNTMKTGSVTIDGVENVTYTIYSNSNSIDISGARDKGEYYIAFATLSAGNYKLKLDKGVESLKQSIKLSISDNELKFDWRGAGGSHPYDKKTKGTITLTITAKSAIDGFENFVKKFFAPTMSGTGANAVWGTASDNKSITITFTTGVNAGIYTATIAQNKNETAFIEANKVNCSYPMIPQSKSYEIEKRNLTLTLKGDGTYIYNTKHQGLTTVNVNAQSGSVGIISGDSVTVSIIVTRGGETYYNYSVSGVNASAKATGVDTINHGVYVATATTGGNNNYNVATGTANWTINRKELSLSGLTGGEKVYDGTAHTPTLKVNGDEVTNGTIQWGNDTISIKFSATLEGDSAQKESLVNVGKYSIKIGGTSGNAIAVSPAKRPAGSGEVDTSDNYTISGSDSTTYEIKPRQIKLTWESIDSFVFSNADQGLKVTGISGVDGNGSLKLISSDITTARITGYGGKDTIVLSLSGSIKHVNDPKSHMTASITGITGTNADGSQPIIGNYEIVEGRESRDFEITPSVVSIKFNAPNATLTKVYDGNKTVPTSQINDSYFSWSATGHNPTRNPFKVTAQYDNKNVGDKKAVKFSYTFTDPTNVGDYVVGTVDGSAYTVGQITPAHIKVALNKLRSGKATRTYTDDEFYGGADGATGNGRSKTYRTGEGFTVSGVLGSDNINVVARYQEADNTRNSNSGNYFDFSKYVNDVYKDADGTFKKASAGTYFKKLVFTMTGTDAANYTFNVYDSSAEGGNKYSESDSTAAAIQSVTVYDSRDSKNNKNASGAASIQIEITVKSVRVEYSDTAQSYANDDNTYNTDWKPITGTNKDMDKADAKIKVSNGWMYADGKDHTAEEGYTKREYRGYTTIRGSQNSERLGAKVDPTNGMDLNYRLSNQPTLTIAYFVSTGDEYEINSLARLLIASFYYTASQNPGNLEIIKIVSSGYKWVSVVSADDYDKGEFKLPQDTPITDSKATTWDEYFTELEAKGYSVFLNIEANAQDNIPANTWGYYATTTSESSTIPTSYKLTKDIVGKFTESDISILNTFFTVIGDDGKTTTSTWSGNGTYLKNVLKAAEGKIATINGSLFVSTAKTEEAGDVTGFGGTFDGNGYVIEYLNIMGYDKENVGLFDIIGANGIVKNLHLRNVTINGNAKYVGGIAGKVLAAADALTEKSVKNVSFHGSINVTGSTDQSVGGLFGISERAVENAIVLGSITVSNANAKVGGVVGSSEQGMSNVVSLMQIDANCNVGAFSQTNTNVTNSYHLQNAVWRRNGSSITFVNHANAKTYDELMSGSVSGYGTTNKYYHESETSVTKGEYDVLGDVVLTKISVDNKENARQRMRLADIVKVYLLMYSLNETQATDSGNLNGANVYAISTSSWLVGTADGTSENAIFIANKQNVSLLRELRFASFTLKANVSIKIASTFSGAFYGSVNAGAYKITCDKAMFEAYTNDASAWLSVQQ